MSVHNGMYPVFSHSHENVSRSQEFQGMTVPLILRSHERLNRSIILHGPKRALLCRVYY